MYAPKDTTKIKTAEELGLTERYWRGLWKVLQKLENGWFVEPDPKTALVQTLPVGKHTFSMAVVHSEEGCGTIGCIMGWAMAFTGNPNPEYLQFDVALYPNHPDDPHDREHPLMRLHDSLVAPPGWQSGAKKYPISRVAPVLRRYLEEGVVEW